MNRLFALVFALLAPLAALGAWTPAGAGLEALLLPGARPTLLALPGSGASGGPSAGAPRVLVVADESPEGLRFVDLDAGVELGAMSLPHQPIALAVDSTGSRAYVLASNDTLHVVDIATRAVLSSFVVGGNAKALLLREASGQVVEVLVAQKGPDRVIGIDPTSGAMLRAADLDRNPATLAWGLAGARILVGAKSGKLYSLDAGDLSIVATAQIGDEIRHISWWEAGGRAIVVHKRTDGVSLVDVSNGQVAAFVALDGDPERSAVDGSTARAYVTTHDDFSVNRVNLSSHALEGRYPLPEKAAGAVFDALSAKLVVAQRGDRRLLRLDPAQASLISILQLNKRLRDIAVNDVTHEAVAVADKADELTRTKLSDLSTAVVALPARPRYVAVDSALNLAVVGHKNKTLRFVDTAQSPPVLLADAVTLADEPDALAVDATRNLTVALTDTKRRIHFVSNVSKTLLSSISLSEDADALALHAGRGLAYVLTDKKKLLLVSLDARAVVQTIALEFRGNAIAVDEARERAVLTTDKDNKAYVLDLATLAPEVTSLAEAGFAQVHGLPKKPGAVKIQSDTGLAVVASKESNALSAVDLDTGALAAGFVALDKPFALAISGRYNQALVLGAEKDEISFVQLANPVPVLASLVPATSSAGGGALTLTLTGQHFVEASRAFFGATQLVTRWLGHGTLEADVPAALLAAPAIVDVTVQNPPPGGGTSNALSFTIMGAPVLNAIVPDSALADGQPKTLALTGQNFASGASVLFGSTLVPASFVDSSNLGVTVPGTLTAVAGVVQLAVVNPGNQVSNALPFTLAPALAIAAISPASGPVGTLVTISGTGFDPVPANNQLVFRGINGTTVPGEALTATATQITVRVPPLAETGPITLTNSQGTVQSPVFTVAREQDFQLVVSPANLTAYQGTSNSAQVQVSSTGTAAFTGLVTVTVQGLPAGVTASVSPAPTLSAFQIGSIAFAATGGAAPGAYPITVQGTFLEGGQPFVRSAGLNLTVGASTGVTGVKGRFVTPERQGIAGVIVRADTTQNPQPQTTTDAAGNFVLTGLPAGEVTFRFDATPANPLYPIWPYTTTVVANQIAVISDWTINPPPPDERFTPIGNATQTQVITDERYPGLQITLPAGVSITGWDGVPKTRIAVERIMPDKLPVPPPPVPIRESYQLYFGTPMGGIPSQPIPIALPNVAELEPGEQTEIWYFDGSPMGGSGEWKLAGLGTVSPDGKTVASNPGVGIPRFCGVCGLVSLSCPPPDKPDQPPPGGCPKCGNPIDLFTGQELMGMDLLNLGGLTPINLSMKYHPVDAYNNRAGTVGSAGFGWVLSYDVGFLPFSGPQKRLVLPGSRFVNFLDDGSGNYKPFDDPGFDGAVITATNAAANEWQLKFRDGRIWRFKPFPGISGFIRGGPPTFVTEMVDAAGNVLSIARQSNGRITGIGSLDRNIAMTYGGNGFVSEIRDTANRVLSFTYTGSNRIQTVTDPDGKVTQFAYVGDNEVPAAAVCAAALDTDGERLKTIQYPGRPMATENFHGASRRILRQLGYDGREHRVAYKVTGACVTNVSSPNVKCTSDCPDVDSWDNFQAGWRIHGGKVIGVTVTDPNGSRYDYGFNARGTTSSSTNMQGQATSSRYDSAHRRVERTDALGRTWKYEYDAKGNRTQEIDPLGRVVSFTYDATWNKPTSITRYLADATPVVQRMSYDSNTGNLLTSTDPLGNVTSYTYTAQGQLETVTVPGNRTSTIEYNAAGDRIAITDPLGNATGFLTDGAGRTVTVTDPLGFQTRSEYNSVNQVTRRIDARNQETRLTYDAAQRLASVIDPRSTTIESYQYDDGDRVVAQVDALSRATGYQYDAAGRLAQLTDRKGQVTAYEYDPANRIARIDYPGSEQVRTYDSIGRLTKISEPGSSIAYSYDNVNRLIRETTDSSAGRHEVAYEYDTLDRLVRRTVNGADPTLYAYDNASRLASITYRGLTTTYVWDAANRLTSRTLPNGIRQEITYDDADRLLSTTYQKPDESVIEIISYTYDAKGQRSTKTVGTSNAVETMFSASYDDANRMTSLTLTATGQSFLLAYDDNGNLASKTDQASPSTVTTYAWDSRNRLTGITASGIEASFTYDGLGRRISKTVNGQTVAFIYDGVQAIGEVVGGSINATLLTGLMIDEVIARYGASGNRTYLADALGSVLALSKDDHSIQNFYEYSAYGETETLGDDEGNSIQYTGRENDGTGLYFYRARYYDPVLKRFISEDPIGTIGGLNLAAYVHGNPISFVDPTGRITIAGAVGLVLGVGAAIYIQNHAQPKPRPGDDPFSDSGSGSGAANDDDYGDEDCPVDCNEWRALLNRMFHTLERLRNMSGADPVYITMQEWIFRKEILAYEKECGPYTPPPSMHDIYTK